MSKSKAMFFKGTSGGGGGDYVDDPSPTIIDYRFEGGGYPTNDLQTWSIPAPTNAYNLVRILYQELENNSDFLRVYEGTDDTGTLLYEYSSSAEVGINGGSPAGKIWIGDLYITTAVFIKFTSDAGAGGEGFHWEIYDQDHPFLVADHTLDIGDTLEYPIGAGNYPDNDLQRWWISGEAGKQITLTFSQFDTEANYDYLTTYNNSPNSTLIEKRSGNSTADMVGAVGEGMYILFTSDGASTKTGFTLTSSLV